MSAVCQAKWNKQFSIHKANLDYPTTVYLLHGFSDGFYYNIQALVKRQMIKGNLPVRNRKK